MHSVVEQTIANIRSRNVDLSTEGDKIVASRPLLPDERKVFEENRSEAVALINASPTETPEQAYQRGQKIGYAAGVRDATEQFQARPPVAAATLPPPTPTTPDEEIAKLSKWLINRGEYYAPVPEIGWEPEVIEKLRSELVAGERVQPMFAYSCIIISASGGEREFKRVPNKKKMNRPPTWPELERALYGRLARRAAAEPGFYNHTPVERTFLCIKWLAAFLAPADQMVIDGLYPSALDSICVHVIGHLSARRPLSKSCVICAPLPKGVMVGPEGPDYGEIKVWVGDGFKIRLNDRNILWHCATYSSPAALQVLKEIILEGDREAGAAKERISNG